MEKILVSDLKKRALITKVLLKDIGQSVYMLEDGALLDGLQKLELAVEKAKKKLPVHIRRSYDLCLQDKRKKKI